MSTIFSINTVIIMFIHAVLFEHGLMTYYWVTDADEGWLWNKNRLNLN